MVNSQGHLDESLAGVKLRGFSDAVAAGMGLPTPLPSPVETAKKRPTLGILSKTGKRRLINEKEVAAWAREAGFDVLVLDCDMHCTKTPWTDLVSARFNNILHLSLLKYFLMSWITKT